MFTDHLEAAMIRLEMRRTLLEWEICMALEDRFLSDPSDTNGEFTTHHPQVADEPTGVTASPFSVVMYD